MYKIGDFSDITKYSIKTLRYYDEIGLLKPSYTDYYSGYRYYESYQVKDALLINKLKKLGLSLSEIKEYLKTKNNNILKNKEREFYNMAEEIRKFVEEDNLKFEQGDYNEYVEWHGKRSANMPLALEIRDDNVDFYLIFDELDYYDDLYVFKNEGNSINLNVVFRPFNEHLDTIMKFLSSKYDKVTFEFDKDNISDVINNIKANYNVIDEFSNQFKGNNGKTFTIDSIVVSFKDGE